MVRILRITKITILLLALVLSPYNAIVSHAATKTCLESGCDMSAQQGYSYCVFHRCKHGSCDSKKMTGSSYCRSHTCYETGCFNEVSSANDRCAKHKAEYYKELGISTTTCNVKDCEKTRAKDSMYCYTHTCHHGSCKSRTLTGSKYCRSHTCAQSGCYNEVAFANEKCEKHKNSSASSSSNTGTTKNSSSSTGKSSTKICTVEGCKSVRTGTSQYCYTHTCHKHGCNRRVAIGSTYCRSHKPKTSYSSGTGGSARTVDDTDVDGFYLDNKSDFDDEDDAWDYLEDDPDEWD